MSSAGARSSSSTCRSPPSRRWLAWRYVDESRSGDAAPLDIGGAFLATAGLGLLTYGLTVVAAKGSAAGGPGLGASATVGLVALGAGVLALIAFVMLEARLGRRAMMPLALFGTRSFVGVSVLTLFLYAALSGMVVLVPYLLITSGGYSAAAAGAALLPLSIAMGLGSRAAGRLAERIGPRVLLGAGPVVAAVGFALFLRLDAGPVDYVTELLPALVLIACGLTLSVAPLTAAVMGAVDAAHVGSASGVNNAIARIGGLLATASLGYVLAGDASAPAFIARFHGAAIVGALLTLAAAGAGFLLVGRDDRSKRPRRADARDSGDERVAEHDAFATRIGAALQRRRAARLDPDHRADAARLRAGRHRVAERAQADRRAGRRRRCWRH